MISGVVSVLKPACVVATIALAMMFVACVWGWVWVDYATFWNIVLSYAALMLMGTIICVVDKSGRSDKPG